MIRPNVRPNPPVPNAVVSRHTSVYKRIADKNTTPISKLRDALKTAKTVEGKPLYTHPVFRYRDYL